MKKFTIEEIRTYLEYEETLGDALFSLCKKNIDIANGVAKDAIPSEGRLMTMNAFKEACEKGILTDNNGHAHFAYSNRMNAEASIEPSDAVWNDELKYTHIVWFDMHEYTCEDHIDPYDECDSTESDLY